MKLDLSGLKNVIQLFIKKGQLRNISEQEKKSLKEPYHIQPFFSVLPKRPKIVHVIANFKIGGSSRLVADLIEHIGHCFEQEILTASNPKPVAYRGVPIHVFSSVRFYKKILNYLEKYKPDIMHVHYWGYSDKPWYEKIIQAGEKIGCKIVENLNTPVAPCCSDSILKYVHVSNYVKNEFGQNPAKDLTIYPGSDFDFFLREERTQVIDDCIGMVYRLEKDKLDEASIEVFIEVAKRRPQIKILIVGGGPFITLYSKAVKKAKVSSSFEFTGFVNYHRLPALYKRMSVFVAPVVRESFGQVTPFAMSMGLPVAGYNVGALSEILGGEDYLAPPKDSVQLSQIILSLIDDREKRLRIGENNMKRAHAKFSVKKMVQDYSVLYKEILGQTR